MDTKLTLKLNKKVIDRAKRYAEKQGNSLSRIVQNYLESITDKKEKVNAIEITPFVKNLMKGTRTSDNLDERKVYREYVTEKYK
jgi:hypothetical protein